MPACRLYALERMVRSLAVVGRVIVAQVDSLGDQDPGVRQGSDRVVFPLPWPCDDGVPFLDDFQETAGHQVEPDDLAVDRAAVSAVDGGHGALRRRAASRSTRSAALSSSSLARRP